MTASVYLTLRGCMTAKHPSVDVLCCEDGSVMLPCSGTHKPRWTFGGLFCNGYLGVRVHNHNYYIHRLIAEAFIPNTANKYSVDHINRVRSDNSVVNLRWATQKEQLDNSVKVLDGYDYGVRKCDDENAYRRARYHRFIEKERDRGKLKHLKKRITQTLVMFYLFKFGSLRLV